MSNCTLIQRNGRPKASFPTLAAANARLAEIKAYNRANGLGARPYEPIRAYNGCHGCDGFHLTHEPLRAAIVAAPAVRSTSAADLARLRRINGL